MDAGRAEEVVPPRYLAAIRAGESGLFAGFWGRELVLPERGESPLPAEALLYYGHGACAHLAKAVCRLVSSSSYGVVVEHWEGGAGASHVYAVASGLLVDARGARSFEEVQQGSERFVLVAGLDPLYYTLALVSHREWEERWLGEERFLDAIPADEEVLACAERAARLLVAHYALA